MEAAKHMRSKEYDILSHGRSPWLPSGSIHVTKAQIGLPPPGPEVTSCTTPTPKRTRAD